MCALRTESGLRPELLATSYRLNIKTQRAKKNTVERCKPVEENKDSSQPSSMMITISDFSTKPHAQIDDELSDTDYDYSSDDDDCLSPYDTSHQAADPSVMTYLASCRKNNCIPISSVKSSLTKNILLCKFVQLLTKDMQCICIALCNCRHVESIMFQQNDIGAKNVTLLAGVIQNSSFITRISITENNLRTDGARCICEAVTKNQKIAMLDLSGNELVESDGHYFRTLIETCDSLRELYLGHNYLSEEGVKQIANAVAKNCTLLVLDLSWNHIRLEGATAIGHALRNNPALEKLNLAWNGLHMEGAMAISFALEKNDTLLELDLTSNRLSDACIVELMRGFDKNTTLQTLRIKKNHISSNGALAILTHLKENKASGITLLDMGTQEVHDRFETMYKDMVQERDILVIYGMVWQSERKSITSFDECEDEVALLSCNPLTVLMECMRLQNFRLLDYFKFLDSNKSNMICIDELCEGLMKLNVPVRRLTLMKLLYRLDKDGNKMLDFAEMMSAQHEYKKKWRESMSGDVEFESTDVGRVSMHLRRIMGKQFVMKKHEHDSLTRPGPPSRGSSGKRREINDSYHIEV